jgi:Nucleoside transporter
LIIFGQAVADYCRRKRTAFVNDLSTDPLNRNSNGNSPQNSVSGDHGSAASAISGAGAHYDHSFFLVMLPLTLYTGIFSLQAVLVLIPHMLPGKFLMVTLCGLAVCGTCGAIATAGIVSTAGLFPSHIGINPFFSGQALGGVAVSMANFVAATVEDPEAYFEQHCSNANGTATALINLALESTAAARIDYAANNLGEDGPNHSCSPYQSLDWAVFSYFVAGCVVLLLCLVGYHLIHTYRMQEFRDDYEVVRDTPLISESEPDGDDVSPRIGLELNDRMKSQPQEQEGIISAPYKDQSPIVSTSSLDRTTFPDSGKAMVATPMSMEDQGPSTSTNSCLAAVSVTVDDRDDGSNEVDEGFEEEYTDEPNEIAVFSAVKGPATCIFLTFTVTLCLFPSWVSELRSSHECKNHFRLSNDLYVPFSFLFFNVGDLMGRMLAERIPVERVRHLSKKLVLGALLRGVFFPLFILCLSTVGSQSNIVLRSDFYSLMVQFLFAVTNGLLVSTSFMWSPHLVGSTAHMQERASEIMTFAVCFGLLSGSLLAFPFMQMATHILR